VRYPNVPLPAGGDALPASGGPGIRLLFVGHHFARKGGCTALRIADIAHRRGWPLSLDIVSSLVVGPKSWVDPTRPDYFLPWFRLMRSLPNVRHLGALPNAAILDLMKTAHFVLLPTLGDTFGFSAIEAMARFTPVVGTDQGALPEFIQDGRNGILLALENNAVGEWKHAGQFDRRSRAYETVFEAETERLANQAIDRIASLAGSPGYAALRTNARATAEALFDAATANDHWDDLYARAVTPAHADRRTRSGHGPRSALQRRPVPDRAGSP
jgi:glycosyltransferase involved in cell wall biosynthesis